MRRLFFVLLLVFLLLPELALLGFFTVGVLLSSQAGLPHGADVVVVLGGGDGARYTRGRELVQAGYSKNLLLIDPPAAERQHAMASLAGVQVWVDDRPHNSWQEAQNALALMRANGWRSALVVSDPPHLLRLRYTWASIFRGTGLSYTLIASNPPWWSAWRWWQNPQSERFVSGEVLKLGYYVLKYRFGIF